MIFLEVLDRRGRVRERQRLSRFPATVGRSYTAGRRQPYLIRKWPGSRWTLPLGPYTLTQLAILVDSEGPAAPDLQLP